MSMFLYKKKTILKLPFSLLYMPSAMSTQDYIAKKISAKKINLEPEVGNNAKL